MEYFRKKHLTKLEDLPVEAQIYQNLGQYSSRELEFIIAQFKAHFEKMGETSFILARQKQPDSIARKFHSDTEHYSMAPETIKDRLGFMIVVPNNTTGIEFSKALQEEFKSEYNPYSSKPVINSSFNFNNSVSKSFSSKENNIKFPRLRSLMLCTSSNL